MIFRSNRGTTNSKKQVIGVSIILLTMMFFGCGSSGSGSETSSPSQTVYGTAAAGAPIAGTVNVQGANGQISYSAIEADGSYTVNVSSLVAPFIVWAEGITNGKNVKLYSVIDQPGRVNVTPATHCVTAMALGDEPDNYFSNNNSAPSTINSGIESAKETVQNLLTDLFQVLDMPSDFDLMNGEFIADGSGFDKTMDAIRMEVNSGAVTFTDSASDTTLFEHNLSSGTTTTSLSSTEVCDIVGSGVDILDRARLVMETIAELYAISAPTLSQLQQEVEPFLASDFLDCGLTYSTALEEWAMDGNGPPIGMEIVSVSLHRKMYKEFFPVEGNQVIKTDELGNNYCGAWVLITIKWNSLSETFLASFVKETETGEWLWNGDRNPFYNVDLDAGSAMYSDETGSTNIYSGLDVWINDEGNQGHLNYGIEKLLILNPGMPLIDFNGQSLHGILTVKDSVSTQYNPDSYGPVFRHWLTESDGLDIDALSNESVFIGLDASDTPVMAWIDYLNGKPMKTALLSSDDFPEIISINGNVPSSSMPSATINNGTVTVDWLHPINTSTIPDEIHVWWSNQNSWASEHVENPGYFDPLLNIESWTSDTVDISGPLNQTGPASYGEITVEYSDLTKDCDFLTINRFVLQ